LFIFTQQWFDYCNAEAHVTRNIHCVMCSVVETLNSFTSRTFDEYCDASNHWYIKSQQNLHYIIIMYLKKLCGLSASWLTEKLSSVVQFT